MFKVALFSILCLIIPVTSYGYVYSSTYQPKLYVFVDGEPVDETITLVSERRAYGKTKLVPHACAAGQCTFRNNHHTDEANWTYRLERKDKEETTLSIVITKQLRGLDFSPNTRQVDHVLRINTEKHTVRSESVDHGAYEAGQAPASAFNISQWQFSPSTVRVFGAVLVLIVVYLGYKMLPIGGHH